MKKRVLVLSLVAVLVLAGIVVWRVVGNLDVIVQSLIEDVGSEVMQTSVKVAKVNLSLTEGKTSISGLTIANPPGFSNPYIFSLNEVSVGIDLSTINKNPIVIDEILIRRPEVYFEINADKQSNLNILNENMTSSSTSSDQEASASESSNTENSETIKLIIRKINFEGGLISAKSAIKLDKTLDAELPVFSLRDLGKDKGGLTPEEITQEITRQLIKQALMSTQNLTKQWTMDKLEEKAQDTLNKKLGNSLDKLLNR